MNEKLVNSANFELVSSYIEDGDLNALITVGGDQNGDDYRWTVIADPETREIKEAYLQVATDDGIEDPDHKPTQEQMDALKKIIVGICRVRGVCK